LTEELTSVRVQPEGDALEENVLRWSADVDPFGRRGIELDYRHSAREKSARSRGEAVALEIAASLDLGELMTPPQRLYRMHPSGVCRMALSPDDGVVDPNLRVFGVRNLFVVGAAVFPSNGIANPTLTVVALTLRLARYLRESFFDIDG
jgi:choline dehydrogenase-like flavoprotein